MLTTNLHLQGVHRLSFPNMIVHYLTILSFTICSFKIKIYSKEWRWKLKIEMILLCKFSESKTFTIKMTPNLKLNGMSLAERFTNVEKWRSLNENNLVHMKDVGNSTQVKVLLICTSKKNTMEVIRQTGRSWRSSWYTAWRKVLPFQKINSRLTFHLVVLRKLLSK